MSAAILNSCRYHCVKPSKQLFDDKNLEVYTEQSIFELRIITSSTVVFSQSAFYTQRKITEKHDFVGKSLQRKGYRGLYI